MYRARLHIFPLVQVCCFVASLYFMDSAWLVSIFLLVAAALFLNFTLHITIHHFVHFRPGSRSLNFILEAAYSMILAFPFSFYRAQHFNHHRYDNRIGDLTSTWQEKNEQLVAKPFFRYSFLWFLGGSVKSGMQKALYDGDLSKEGKGKIKYQFFLILGFYILLIFLNPLYALAYSAMFYLGWCFIAITNYGQHLPVKYDSTPAYTYDNKVYNSLFFNNGLHLEHHLEPHLNYNELITRNKSKISWPHLIVFLFRSK